MEMGFYELLEYIQDEMTIIGDPNSKPLMVEMVRRMELMNQLLDKKPPCPVGSEYELHCKVYSPSCL